MKIFTADHYFQIGAMHYSAGKPCQDYALSGANKDIACAMVSDGCSTGRHTDIGARIQTLSTLQAIREEAKGEGKAESIIARIHLKRRRIIQEAYIILGLDHSDMLATNAYACVKEDGAFVHLEGDGVIAIRYKSGLVEMDQYEWKDNIPFYPAYEMSDLKGFIEAHDNDMEAERVLRRMCVMQPNGEIEFEHFHGLSLKKGLRGFTRIISEEELGTIECIAVFTDGVSQIDGVEWKDAVRDFLAFKNFGGEFAKRRMIRGIKDMHKVGSGPQDDISYAVIHITNIEVEEVTHATNSEGQPDSGA